MRIPPGAVLIDSAVFAYALGDSATERDACRRFLASAIDDTRRAYASVELVQEVVHHRLRRTGDRVRAVQEGREISAALTLLDFDRGILDLSLGLIERLPTIRGRDAVHAATAIAYGIDTIASPDRAFDAVPGLTRVDPLAVG